jgi:hypothetical protein
MLDALSAPAKTSSFGHSSICLAVHLLVSASRLSVTSQEPIESTNISSFATQPRTNVGTPSLSLTESSQKLVLVICKKIAKPFHKPHSKTRSSTSILQLRCLLPYMKSLFQALSSENLIKCNPLCCLFFGGSREKCQDSL